MSTKLPKLTNKSSDQTGAVMEQTLQALTEGITGLAASDRRSIALSMGHILQRIRGGQFLSQVKKEWEAYRQGGRIKDDYLKSTQHQECFQELLDFLDGDSPDQQRFNALKNIFLRAASEEKSDRESILPQQYMRIIRSLTSGEVILLFSSFEYTDTVTSANEWIREIARRSSLHFPELVKLHEEGLMQKQLLTPRKHGDKSGVFMGNQGRLTALGYNLCLFIQSEDIQIDKDKDF